MNLFFDLDGTVTDSRPGIVASMNHALRSLGVTPPPESELLRFIGPPTHDAFPELLGSNDPAYIQRAIDRYRERYGTVGLFESTLYPGVRAGIEALTAAGARCWIVTSKPRVYAEPMLVHHGIAHLFVKIYGSELNGERGNKGELIAYVLASEGLRPEACWMLGDRKHDIVGALRNQVHPAGVLWGYGTTEELSAAGAERLFATMPDVVAGFFPHAT